jgi:hypothetical protein
MHRTVNADYGSSNLSPGASFPNPADLPAKKVTSGDSRFRLIIGERFRQVDGGQCLISMTCWENYLDSSVGKVLTLVSKTSLSARVRGSIPQLSASYGAIF